MTLLNLCSLADSYYIAELKGELNQDYFSSSDLIYSDGTFDHHINKDGYIKITNLQGANYILFMDQSGNIFLSIYKYTSEPKYKEIIDNMNHIRDQTGMYKHSESIFNNIAAPKINIPKDKVEVPREEDEVLKLANDELVNINNLSCSVCGSTNFVEPFELDHEGTIRCQCNQCRTIYELMPSKYYLVKSKTIFNAIQDNTITKRLTKTSSQEDKKK